MSHYDREKRMIQKRVVGELGAAVPIFSLDRLSDTLTNIGIMQTLALEGRSNKSNLVKGVEKILANLPHVRSYSEFRVPAWRTIDRHVDDLEERGYIKAVANEKWDRNPKITITFYDLTPKGYMAVQMLSGFRNKSKNLAALYEKHDDMPSADAEAFKALYLNCEELSKYIAQESLRNFQNSGWESLDQAEIIPKYLEHFALFASSIYDRGLKGRLPKMPKGELENLEMLVKTNQGVKSLMLDSTGRYLANRQEEITRIDRFRKALTS